MLATATITYDLSDYGLADFDSRRTKVWATNNVNGPVIDTEGNAIHLGSAIGTVNADGTGSITVPTPGTGSNPASWQTTIHVDYPDRHAPRGRDSLSFGPFTITVSADLADLIDEQAIPPDYAGELVATVEAGATAAAASATSAAASADAAATIVGLTGEDAAVAFLVEDAGSDTSAALSATIATVTDPINAELDTLPATYAPKVDLRGQIAQPFIIAHRGGHLIHGEHSLEAYTAVAEAGFAIEPDVHIIADSELVCCHDATTTRTMLQVAGTAETVLGNLTSDQFVKNYVVLPEVKGSPYERPIKFSEVLDLFGGRTLIVPEMKSTNTRVPMVAAIKARNLEKAVLVSSFNFDDMAYAAGEGIPSMWVTDSGDPATMAAAGIGYVGLSSTATLAYANSCRAAGLEVVRYTINSRTDADAFLAQGDIGYFSDDPWWTGGRYARSYTDPYRARVPWPHMVTGGLPRTNITFANGGVGQMVGAAANVFLGQDWCPPIASGKAQIDFTIEFLPYASADTRWVGIGFGVAASESAITDTPTAGQDCVMALFRRNGTWDVYDLNPTTVVSIGTAAKTALAQPNRVSSVRMRFRRTATEIILTNLDLNETLTIADSTNLWANSRFSFGANGTDFIVRDVTVTPIA